MPRDLVRAVPHAYSTTQRYVVGLHGMLESLSKVEPLDWLEVDLQTRFASRVLAIDGAVADRWGWIMALKSNA